MAREIKDVVIVGMGRSPIGDFGGALSSLTAVELMEQVARKTLERFCVSPSVIEEVTLGIVYKHGLKGNPARQVQLNIGIPESGGAVTVDQQCASGMRALEVAVQQIELGKSSVSLVCGVESMSNVPYLLTNYRNGLRMGDGKVVDPLLYDALHCAFSGEHMMWTAENVAREYNVSREDQDKYSKLSHDRALSAIREGKFNEEIIPIEIVSKKGTKTVTTDEHPRDVTLEKLGSLKPAYLADGTVTAGNASSINDGAAAMILMSAEKAKELNLKPLAKILSTATVGVKPEVMGIGPIYSLPKALEFANLTMEEIDYFEINEAFAAQVIPCLRELNIPLDKVNANGSGISLGHPVGMTGLRIVIANYYELKRRGGKYGVSSLCVGGGPSMATVIELLD